MCEIAEVYKIDKTKARKPHKCRECGGVIAKGEIYNRHHGVFDGSGFDSRVCLDCDALRAEVDKDKPSVYDQTCVEELGEVVFGSGNTGLIRAFITNKRKRGAPVTDWQAALLEELERPKTQGDAP